MQKRNTIQRQLVIAAVRSLGNHPTAEQVYNDIITKYPDISKGTVYRNLNTLVESGLLSKVSVPSAADRYDYILTKHYHVQCTRCKSLSTSKAWTITRIWTTRLPSLPVSGWRTMISCSPVCAPNARLRQLRSKV